MSEEKKETQLEEEVVKDKKKFKEKLAAKDEEIKALGEQVNHWKNEYYRAYADTQNLRKSLEKDHRDAMKYRIEGFVDSLLPVLDSFHMACSAKQDNPELKNYVLGFNYIYKNLINVLSEEGLVEIDPQVGDKFDDSTMEGVELEESDGEESLVMKVHCKGYKLHDRLIRAARVTVSKKKEEKPTEDK